jgi:hypothetical protein
MTGNRRSLAVNVEQNGAFFRACVDDGRIETRELFEGLTAEERNALAVEAWNVGIRALAIAGRVAREADEPRRPTRLSTIPPSSW